MRTRVPTIASGAVRKLLAIVESEGLDPTSCLAEIGLDAAIVVDGDARVPLEKLHALWEAVLRAVPRAEHAILGAERYSLGDYGLVGFVAMNSGTLREAIRHAVRYLGLWTDEPEIALDEDGTMTFDYRSAFEDRVGVRFATEAALAEILNGARRLTRARLTPRAVRFTHRGPRDVSAHDAFFGCSVQFGAADNAMAFDEADLARPLPNADPQLGAYLRSLANEALDKRGGASPLDRIKSIMAEELQSRVPSLAIVAKRMATSERTLRRRLENEGTSFRTLLEDTRAQLARSYVSDKRIPLAEVAFLLGFSEPSAFHRAFKRWTGCTPNAFRARA